MASSLRLRDELLTAKAGLEVVSPTLGKRAMGEVLHGTHRFPKTASFGKPASQTARRASLARGVSTVSQVRATEKLVKECYALRPMHLSPSLPNQLDLQGEEKGGILEQTPMLSCENLSSSLCLDLR